MRLFFKKLLIVGFGMMLTSGVSYAQDDGPEHISVEKMTLKQEPIQLVVVSVNPITYQNFNVTVTYTDLVTHETSLNVTQYADCAAGENTPTVSFCSPFYWCSSKITDYNVPKVIGKEASAYLRIHAPPKFS